VGRKALGFENRALVSMSFLSALFALLFIFPANLGQGYPVVHHALVMLYAFLTLGIWALARFRQLYLYFTFLLGTFLILASIFFFNSGLYGTIPWYLVQIYIFSFVLLRSKKRLAMILIQSLIDGRHDAHFEQGLDQFSRLD